jgi:hypothetical protein
MDHDSPSHQSGDPHAQGGVVVHDHEADRCPFILSIRLCIWGLHLEFPPESHLMSAFSKLLCLAALFISIF